MSPIAAVESSPRMSLRDQMACSVVNALVIRSSGMSTPISEGHAKFWAELAYMIADKMLEERDK